MMLADGLMVVSTAIAETSSYTTGVAKVRPAGRMRPFNLLLRPANLFVITKNLN